MRGCGHYQAVRSQALPEPVCHTLSTLTQTSLLESHQDLPMPHPGAGRKPLVVSYSNTPLLADLVTHQNKILVIEMRKVSNTVALSPQAVVWPKRCQLHAPRLPTGYRRETQTWCIARCDALTCW